MYPSECIQVARHCPNRRVAQPKVRLMPI